MCNDLSSKEMDVHDRCGIHYDPNEMFSVDMYRNQNDLPGNNGITLECQQSEDCSLSQKELINVLMRKIEEELNITKIRIIDEVDRIYAIYFDSDKARTVDVKTRVKEKYCEYSADYARALCEQYRQLALMLKPSRNFRGYGEDANCFAAQNYCNEAKERLNGYLKSLIALLDKDSGAIYYYNGQTIGDMDSNHIAGCGHIDWERYFDDLPQDAWGKLAEYLQREDAEYLPFYLSKNKNILYTARLV